MFRLLCNEKLLNFHNVIHFVYRCFMDLKFVLFLVVINYLLLKKGFVDGMLPEYIILVGLFYWLFASKAYNMVDVLTARLHEAYTSWQQKGNTDETRLTLSGLRRFGGQQKRDKAFEKELANQMAEKYLYQVKENPPPLMTPLKPRPLMGKSCLDCTPISRKESLVSKTVESLNVKNILKVETGLPYNNFLTRKFCYLIHTYRLKKFDYPQVSETVINDERLKDALHLATTKDLNERGITDDEAYKEQLRKNESRAKKILYDMRSQLSDLLLRITTWLTYKLLNCFVSSVVVHPGHIEMLKQAGESGKPIIFLPLHRSHLDYILISFILMQNNVRSPLVAAGDNLNIPLFGSLLRGLGAFYIKRRIDPVLGRKDIVYRAVLHTYMIQALRAGHNIEFFIEGGRTRTGKPVMPKGGILSVIIDAYMDGTIEDALLVPVSLNYERLADGNFIKEQLGQSKQMESFGAALRAIWEVLNSNYGMFRVDFNQPFSIKELVKTFHIPSRSPSPEEQVVETNGFRPKPKLTSQPSSTSLYGTDVVEEKHRMLVESIARHVLYDCSKATSVMSTNAIAFLLLNRFRDGCTMEQLVIALDKLRNELDWANRDVGFSGDSLDVINHACDILGPALIKRDKVNNKITPVTMIPNVIELAYYSNGMITCFVVESVVATALSTLVPNLNQSSLLLQDDLVERSKELFDILKYEFIFYKPCQNAEVVINDAIENLKAKGILSENERLYTEKEQWGRRIAKTFDNEDSDEDSHEVYAPEPNLKFNEDYKDEVNFLRGLVRPLIEAYCASISLCETLVDRTVTEKDFLLDCMEEVKKELHLGNIAYSESLSVDPIRNCFKLLLHWDVLESHIQDKIRLYYLSEHYETSESLEPIVQKVFRYKTPLNNNN